MHALDLSIFYSLYHLSGHSMWSDWLIVCIAEYIPYVIIVAVVYAAYQAWRSKKKKEVLGYSLALLSGIVARGVAGLIRFFYHHPRPFVSLHLISLFPENSYSFPSGHAIFYFALASGVYQVNKRFGRILYGLAFLIGLARVAAGVHYPSDILAGAILGVLIAKTLFGLCGNNEK